MTDPSTRAASPGQRLIRACFPSSWRRDGRANDMIVTALTAAETDQREGLGPYDVADLVAFGLRMRGREIGEEVPWAARTVLAWGGLLSGLFIAVLMLMLPARADPQGRASFAHSWYPALGVVWLILAIAVFSGRPLLIRVVTATTLAAAALIAVLGAGFGRPSVLPDTANDWRIAWLAVLPPPPADLYLVLPLSLFALMTVDNRPLTSPPRWLTAALLVATILLAADVGGSWNGWLFLSAPPALPPAARDAIVLLAAVLIVLLARWPRAAPATLLVAIPWTLPATISQQSLSGERVTIAPGPIAAGGLLVLGATLAIWRPRPGAQTSRH